MRNKILSFFILLVTHLTVWSQIVDDTTKVIYSPKTTFWTTESGFLADSSKHVLDTGLFNLEKFTMIDSLHRSYQDLGINGSPVTPLVWKIPTTIGARFGYDVLDIYVKKPVQYRYYDTKGPFTELNANFGGQGRVTTGVDFARNISPKWNIGFDFYRFTSDKPIGSSSTRGDINYQMTHIDIHSSYRSEREKYRVLGHIARFDHQTQETGGILVSSTTINPASYFLYRQSSVQLTDAGSRDLRFIYHFTHQYQLKKWLKIYQSIDRNVQEWQYFDYKLSTNEWNYYPRFIEDSTSIYSSVENNEWKWENGITGYTPHFNYKVYVKYRDVYQEHQDSIVSRAREGYLGGNIALSIKKKVKMQANGEIERSGFYFLNGKFSIQENIRLGYTSALYRPTLYQSLHYHAFELDTNNLSKIFVNQLFGELRFSRKNIDFQISFQSNLISNFVYLNDQLAVTQTDEAFSLNYIHARIHLQFPLGSKNENIHIISSNIYTQTIGNEGDNIRFPTFRNESQVHWNGFWFKNTLEVQLGVTFHFRTQYSAQSYQPAIGQFYLNNTFNTDIVGVNTYATIDPFISIKMANLSIFARLVHANQASNSGYFVTPFYPGQERTFDVGARWLFFD